jgi:hypothetical protein
MELFEHTQIKVSVWAKNTIQNILKPIHKEAGMRKMVHVKSNA